MSTEPTPDLLELRELLRHSKEVTASLLKKLDGPVDLVDLVSGLESLATLDERRARLLDQFRKQASSLRQREEERSIDARERVRRPRRADLRIDVLDKGGDP